MEKIFIIDNEEKIRTVLSRIITLEGFELFQAYDLENARKRCDVSGIDISITKEGNKIKFSVQDFGKGISAALRLLMKEDATTDTDGNILTPSKYPMQVYSETILPVPSKKSKIVIAGVLAAEAIFMITRSSVCK